MLKFRIVIKSMHSKKENENLNAIKMFEMAHGNELIIKYFDKFTFENRLYAVIEYLQVS